MSELIKNLKLHEGFRFQSPRSGQICSNLAAARKSAQETAEKFQSPRSGQIYSNLTAYGMFVLAFWEFQSPRSGQICSNITVVDCIYMLYVLVSIPLIGSNLFKCGA